MEPHNVAFSRTREGLLGARVGDLALLAIPDLEDGFRIVTAWRLTKAPEDWTVVDFHGVSRIVATEQAFRDYAEEQGRHQRELTVLNRREIKSAVMTPWGMAQTSRIYADGVVFHVTAGHGGFELSSDRNALVHSGWRNDDGFYEEDSQWAKVAAAFPELFTAFERRCADQSLRDWEPDAYEAIYGVTLAPGESTLRDQQNFRREHAADWIVVSAINSTHHPGFVECVATRGGDRHSRNEQRFLVPTEDYRVGRHGFVIDEARHAPYHGPSSFIGWRRNR